jgi:hypothetical protein
LEVPVSELFHDAGGVADRRLYVLPPLMITIGSMWKLPSVSFAMEKMTVSPSALFVLRGAFVWAAPGIPGMSKEIIVNDKIRRMIFGRRL